MIFCLGDKQAQQNELRNEIRDSLEVLGGGGLSNPSSIWQFLNDGSNSNESGELVTDSTALGFIASLSDDGFPSVPTLADMAYLSLFEHFGEVDWCGIRSI